MLRSKYFKGPILSRGKGGTEKDGEGRKVLRRKRTKNLTNKKGKRYYRLRGDGSHGLKRRLRKERQHLLNRRTGSQASRKKGLRPERRRGIRSTSQA